jgi:Uma2 family endonuclease
VQVPLTRDDFLNPQEGDVMPQRTFHEETTSALRDMLRLRYAAEPGTAVFHDLIMRWGIPGLSEPSPDIAVVPNVRERERDRGSFWVQKEGTKPVLVIEVVSPFYRQEDLVDKVDIYERAGVQEYAIVEQREQRGQMVETVTGYRLANGRYRPILLDDEGWMLLRTVGLFITLREGRVLLKDAETGERLRNAEELEAARSALEAELEKARSELALLKGK